MSQSTDITLAPNITGTAQRTELNDILTAILTGHSGASRPSYLTGKTGGWTKIVSGTVHELYYFDGADDILMGTVDFSTNAFTPSGSSAAFANAVNNKTAAYTLVDGDCGKIITGDATAAAFTLAINPTAGLRAGWFVIVQKTDATANNVTIDPDSTNTINGVTTFALGKQYDAAMIIRATSSTFIAVLMPNTANVARLDGAAFTVIPTMPTASSGDNTTKGATTAFVTAAVAVGVSGLAPLASPAFTGNPTAPTQSSGNNTTRLATTAFVQQEISALAPSGVIKVIREQIFTASGTYTPHPNMVYCDMVALGGGGGAGAAAISGAGTAGGTTTVTGLLSATGGAAGNARVAGDGGVGSSGTLNCTGGAGDPGYAVDGTNGVGGAGGSNPWGAGGKAIYSTSGSGQSGNSGEGYGAGGGGGKGSSGAGNHGGSGGGSGGYAIKTFSAASVGASRSITIGTGGAGGTSGGSGTSGLVIVKEYCTA